MNACYRRSWLTGVVIVSVVVGMSGCAAPSVDNAIQAPETVSPHQVTVTSPTHAPSTPLDDAADTSIINSRHEVTLGETTEILPSPSRRYRVRMEDQSVGIQHGAMIHAHRLYLYDNETGQELRVGDDTGQADFEAMDDEYLIWRWSLCDPRPCQIRPEGLYAYNLVTGEETYIGLGIDVWMSNPWIVFSANEGSEKHLGLRAYDLETGEVIVVTRARAAFLGIRTNTLYHINEGMIAWVNLNEVTGQISLVALDLNTSVRRVLDIPESFEGNSPPSKIRVSRTQVVWQNGTQHGYDLRYDALYSIPVMPPGLENFAGNYLEPISVSGNYVTWALEFDGQTRYFIAPVVVDGEVPPMLSPLPTATVVYQSIFHDLSPEPPTDTPMPSETPAETPTPEPPTDTPLPPPTDTPTDTPLPPPTDTPTPEPGR